MTSMCSVGEAARLNPVAPVPAGVTGLRAGDSVFGIAPGCLGAAVIVPADIMVPLPPHLGFAAAASAPTVYCTVHAALGDELTIAGKKAGPTGR